MDFVAVQTMKKRIDISMIPYFPKPFFFLGGLLIIGAGVALLDYQQPFVGLLLILISLTIFTAHYRFAINLTAQTYQDYLWIAGFKRGKKEQFNTIDGLSLTENAYRQTTHAIVNSTTQQGTEYNGYITLDAQDIHLLSDKHKRKVLSKLEQIQNALTSNIVLNTQIAINIDITDYTLE